MRYAPIIALLATGCLFGDDEQLPLPEGTSCELRATSLTPQPHKIDILLVVDRAPAMTELADDLAYNLPRFANVLENVEGGRPDLHIGVVSSDLGGGSGAGCSVTGDDATLWSEPQGDGCSSIDGDYLIAERGLWFQCGDRPGADCGPHNYDGSFADALTCTAALPAGTCQIRQPLLAAERALTAAPSGFLRDDGFLMVLFISSGDDDGTAAVSEHADTLKALYRDPGQVIASVIAPPSASRLLAFADQFPQRNTVTDIANQDWSDALLLLAETLRVILGYSCLELPAATTADVDSSNPGLQPACFVTDPTADGASIPACEMADDNRPAVTTPIPCWWIDTSDQASCEEYLRPRVEGLIAADWRCDLGC